MPSISDAIQTIKTGVLTLSLVEYGHIKPTNIIGISPGNSPRIFFDEEGFNPISKLKLSITSIICHKSRSIMFPIPEWQLRDFGSLKIFKKFPHFFEIIDTDNYLNSKDEMTNITLVNRSHSMLIMWRHWNDAGLPHFYSCLQSLQRQIAARMKTPLLQDFKQDQKNGLSIEYQSEIYSNHLYGAKLLDAWHIYLIESKGKEPEYFLKWLQSLSTEKLAELDISSLKDIPTVKYITDDKERSEWKLTITPQRIVRNALLPFPNKVGEEIEIIFDLGKSTTDDIQFYGAVKQRGFINHSTFFAGEKVLGAGRMRLKAELSSDQFLRWVIQEVDDNSGHIKPDNGMNIQILEALKNIGCDLNSIIWKTVWGTRGLKTETAEMALNRLTNHCIEIDLPALPRDQIQTPFLIQLNIAASNGLLGKIIDLLNTHTLTKEEVIPTAILIQHALEKHLHLYKEYPAHPKTVSTLALKARDFLRMAGYKSEAFEKDLQRISKSYEKYFQLQSNQPDFSLSVNTIFERSKNEILRSKIGEDLNRFNHTL